MEWGAVARYALYADLYILLWLSDVSGKLESASRSQKNYIMQTVAPQANTRQGGVDLRAKILPLLPPNANPLALGALGSPKAIWRWVLLPPVPWLCPTIPPEHPFLAAGIDSRREGCYSTAGKPAQKSCSALAKFAQFPSSLQINDPMIRCPLDSSTCF